MRSDVTRLVVVEFNPVPIRFVVLGAPIPSSTYEDPPCFTTAERSQFVAPSCPTIRSGEVLHGIMLLPSGRRRNALEAAAEAMFGEDFGGRVLPFGGHEAHFYARIASERRRARRPISRFNAQIAAIAPSVGAAIATRAAADYDACGVVVINPWTAQ